MSHPVIWWVRRDMRLGGNPALQRALDIGGPVIPVFILDEVSGTYGACPRWRMGLGAEALDASLRGIGSRLVFRRGKAVDVLRQLVRETGAQAVVWTRAYDPDAIGRDGLVKAGLKQEGVLALSIPGHILFEPWEVQTKANGFFRVYTPFWKAVRDRDVPPAAPKPDRLPAPGTWPDSEDPASWGLADAMNRGAEIVRPHLNVGEGAADARLHTFIAERIDRYRDLRDFPAEPGTSRLSENLAWGEISIHQCWHAGQAALREGARGAETFLKELVWREFAYHLVYHTPGITRRNWREDWDAFPWNEKETQEVTAWKQGRTGIPFVDAAMRELYVTGQMHNRARMIVGSYLTKHLLSHWRIGQRWFEDCLADWDPASNAMGWQWVAGSGPDAAPYFRVFNPVTQLDKFDGNRAYADRWIAEGKSAPSPDALSYFAAVPRNWSISAADPYPEPVVTAAAGRERALEAYAGRGGQGR